MIIGESKVLLKNTDSRKKETNIGDFVTDAMIDWVSIYSQSFVK